MQEFNPSEFNATKKSLLCFPRIQDGFLPFIETPSDEYEQSKDADKSDKDHCRINAFELFSIFTADIIKEEVLFIR
ncbi:MAG: hypothetical protein ABIO81_00255 [Ginsengibacter sp.]